MKFTLKACKRLKSELQVDFENLGEALQDPDKAIEIAKIGLETAGMDNKKSAEDLTVGEILDAITRDMGAGSKKSEAQS